MSSDPTVNARLSLPSAAQSPTINSLSTLPSPLPLQSLPLMNLNWMSPGAMPMVASQMPSPSSSLKGLAEGDHPWKEPAMCTPFTETVSCVVMSTRNVTWVGLTQVPHALKQGAANVEESPTNTMFSLVTSNTRFPKSSAQSSPARASLGLDQLLPLMYLKTSVPSSRESG